MRVRITNQGESQAVLDVDHGDDPEKAEVRPGRALLLAPGESIEVRVGQRGRILSSGQLEIVPIPKNPSTQTRKGPAVSAGKEQR